MSFLTLSFLLVLILAVLAGGAIALGEMLWKSETRTLRAGLEAVRHASPGETFSTREFEGLPAPVRRFFLTALPDKAPLITAVMLGQTGIFNLGETTDRWKPFTADQRVIIRRPGFDWNARIALLPGVWLRIHDAYLAGEGRLHVALYGLVSQASLRDTGDLARGELMRFFLESPWYPTALLPSQGVTWTAVDDHSAHATLKDGNHKITLLFHFGADGLIDTVRAEARTRMSGGTTTTMPWQGRFWNYATRGGMQVPLEAEVAWQTPDGPKPYCQAQLATLAYEFSS